MLRMIDSNGTQFLNLGGLEWVFSSPGRDRLRLVLAYACGSTNKDLHVVERLIAELRDESGTLIVTWKSQPSLRWRRAMERAWKVVGNEWPEHVKHEWPGGSSPRVGISAHGSGKRDSRHT
jgi:hypothetical protein